MINTQDDIKLDKSNNSEATSPDVTPLPVTPSPFITSHMIPLHLLNEKKQVPESIVITNPSRLESPTFQEKTYSRTSDRVDDHLTGNTIL